MTKSELVDQVADRAQLTKQDAARAVDAVLATVEDALRRGSEVAVSGFGKFHVSERGATRGRQPEHRRADRDRSLEGAAVHGRQRPQECCEESLTPPSSFGDTLAARVSERGSQLVLGLDPDPGELWPAAPGAEAPPDWPGDASRQRPRGRCSQHCRALIDATAGSCVAVKPQLARFEALGRGRQRCPARGLQACAREQGLLVIADGKRGDIDVTAAAYAAALLGGADSPFGHLDGLGADLITVNPLMGRDAIEPFVEAARASGAGVLLLVRTSNPGAADIEDLELAGGGDGLGADRPGWSRSSGRPGIGASGFSDVGAVVGATAPGHLQRARELMGQAVFLLPGIGAQGGRVEELRAAFQPGRAGGLVSASRSIARRTPEQRRRAGCRGGRRGRATARCGLEAVRGPLSPRRPSEGRQSCLRRRGVR